MHKQKPFTQWSDTQRKHGQECPNHLPRRRLGHYNAPAAACFCIALHFPQALSATLGGCSRDPPAWSLWHKTGIEETKSLSSGISYQFTLRQHLYSRIINMFIHNFKSLHGKKQKTMPVCTWTQNHVHYVPPFLDISLQHLLKHLSPQNANWSQTSKSVSSYIQIPVSFWFYLFLHCIFKSQSNWEHTADKFNKLTLESTTLHSLLLVSFTIGYLLETKETSLRKCLNKIKWVVFKNICVN